MKVYVVMGNDFPDAVFDNEVDAEAYCKRKKTEPRANALIYWRYHKFDLNGKPE